MHKELKNLLAKETQNIKDTGLYKKERIIITPQAAAIKVQRGRDVLNFRTNSYLGLSDNLCLIKATKDVVDSYRYGMSSVRFICGTQDIHKRLERVIAHYFHTEDAIFHVACFDVSSGVFELLFGSEDAIISDSLNHASIIDGVRPCKARHYRYANINMEELEKRLQEVQEQHFRIIVTDGVFNMDGGIVPMDKICDPADRYDALVMVDECHSADVVGKTGRGIAKVPDRSNRIDIRMDMLGKAFGGAIDGFTAGPKEIIETLRQRSRPYLFPSSLSPVVVGAGLEVFKMLEEDDLLYTKPMENVKYFRDKVSTVSFGIKPTQSAICAVMFYDAPLSQRYAAHLLEGDVYVTDFYYPVVPKGEARIHVQLPVTHERKYLSRAVVASVKVGKELGVIKQRLLQKSQVITVLSKA